MSEHHITTCYLGNSSDFFDYVLDGGLLCLFKAFQGTFLNRFTNFYILQSFVIRFGEKVLIKKGGERERRRE